MKLGINSHEEISRINDFYLWLSGMGVEGFREIWSGDIIDKSSQLYHFWSKWEEVECDPVRFWVHMDVINRQKLVEMYNIRYEEN